MNSAPPSAEQLLASARELRPLIEAEAPQIERNRQLTPAVVEALRSAGLYKMLVPRSLGGSEIDLLSFSKVMEAIAMGDGSAAWCVGQNSGISRVSAYLPEQGAQEVFGAPDAILSWGNGPATAQPVNGADVDGFRDAMDALLHPDVAAVAARRGLARARSFQWDVCAQHAWRAYTAALEAAA